MDALPDSYLLMAKGSDYTGYPMPVSQAHAALLAMGDGEQAEDILIFATDPESVMLDMQEAKERIARTVRSEFETPDLGEFHDHPEALRRIAESYWMEAPRQNPQRGKRKNPLRLNGRRSGRAYTGATFGKTGIRSRQEREAGRAQARENMLRSKQHSYRLAYKDYMTIMESLSDVDLYLYFRMKVPLNPRTAREVRRRGSVQNTALLDAFAAEMEERALNSHEFWEKWTPRKPGQKPDIYEFLTFVEKTQMPAIQAVSQRFGEGGIIFRSWPESQIARSDRGDFIRLIEPRNAERFTSQDEYELSRYR